MNSIQKNILNNKLLKINSLTLRNFLILVLFVFITPLSLSAQSRQDLEKQRIKLQNEIKEINTLLFKSRKKEKIKWE